MKNAFTRALAVATLFASMSAFAISKKSDSTKGADQPEPTNISCPADEPNGGDNQTQTPEQQKIKQQDRQWLHDLEYPSNG